MSESPELEDLRVEAMFIRSALRVIRTAALTPQPRGKWRATAALLERCFPHDYSAHSTHAAPAWDAGIEPAAQRGNEDLCNG
jgi:hypothetical protein